MPLCTTILDKWLYVCRRLTSKGLLPAFLCLPNGRCNDAIAHFARTSVFLKNEWLSSPERLFFSETSDCQSPNECFSQKRMIVNPRTIVFLKNERLSTPERLFFLKTCDCQPPNEWLPQWCNSPTHWIGYCNDATGVHLRHAIWMAVFCTVYSTFSRQ